MPALDPERFAALRRDFPGADLGELLGQFLQLTEPTVAALAAGVGAGDAEAVRDAAHRLRGGCLAIGALELAGTAGDIETRVLASGLDAAVVQLAARVDVEWAELQRAVSSY